MTFWSLNSVWGEIPFRCCPTKPHVFFICPLFWHTWLNDKNPESCPKKKNTENFGSVTRPCSRVSDFFRWPLTLFPPFIPPPFVLFNSYCVYLRVKQASAACKLKLWSAHLVRERLVCAECQSDAMSKKDRCGGEGLDSTRWALEPKHKSGRWTVFI